MSDQPAHRPPSIVDVLARQALALSVQISAVRATTGEPMIVDGFSVTRAALVALEAQHEALLETVRLLQDVDLQRRAAASVRAATEVESPKLPPVFGRPTPPTLAPVPAEMPRGVPVASPPAGSS